MVVCPQSHPLQVASHKHGRLTRGKGHCSSLQPARLLRGRRGAQACLLGLSVPASGLRSSGRLAAPAWVSALLPSRLHQQPPEVRPHHFISHQVSTLTALCQQSWCNMSQSPWHLRGSGFTGGEACQCWGLTSNGGGNGLGSNLVVDDEGAPELAVLLPEGVRNLHDEPVVQQHQLWLLPAAAKPPVPEACTDNSFSQGRCAVGTCLHAVSTQLEGMFLSQAPTVKWAPQVSPIAKLITSEPQCPAHTPERLGVIPDKERHIRHGRRRKSMAGAILPQGVRTGRALTLGLRVRSDQDVPRVGIAMHCKQERASALVFTPVGCHEDATRC